MAGYTEIVNDAFVHGTSAVLVDVFDADETTVISIRYDDGHEKSYIVYEGGDVQAFVNVRNVKDRIIGSRVIIADLGWPSCVLLVQNDGIEKNLVERSNDKEKGNTI